MLLTSLLLLLLQMTSFLLRVSDRENKHVRLWRLQRQVWRVLLLLQLIDWLHITALPVDLRPSVCASERFSWRTYDYSSPLAIIYTTHAHRTPAANENLFDFNVSLIWPFDSAVPHRQAAWSPAHVHTITYVVHCTAPRSHTSMINNDTMTAKARNDPIEFELSFAGLWLEQKDHWGAFAWRTWTLGSVLVKGDVRDDLCWGYAQTFTKQCTFAGL